MIFNRPQLAEQMAQQLLNPGVLDEGLRSGLFLSGLRRTGKTTFILADLIPALEEKGALVVYVDLWSDTLTSPTELLHKALLTKLTELQKPSSSALASLKRINGLDLGGFGFKFGFKLQDIGKPGGTTLAQVLTAVVDLAKTNLVLIVDEVQQAMTTDEGQNLLLALKAARDAINPRPTTPGHFLFIGTGSHRAQLSELTSKRNQAFAGATSANYPLLGSDYVQFLIGRVAEQIESDRLPSMEVANKAFATLGHRPEEMIKALNQMIRQGGDPDVVLPIIAGTLRSSAADNEILKVESLGQVAVAIFAKIAASEEPVKMVFSSDASKEYSEFVGREVKVEEIQPVVNALMADNLIMRKGHGAYTVSDPFVGAIWRESRQISLFGEGEKAK